MNIVFIRHGDPDYKNDTLTEKGIREALQLKKRINRIDDADFFTSPLGRARRTAEIALADKKITPTVLEYMQEFYYPVEDLKDILAREKPDLERKDIGENQTKVEKAETKLEEKRERKKRIPWDFMPADWSKVPMLYDKELWLQTELMQSGEVPQKYAWVTKSFDELLTKYGYFREGRIYKATPGSDKTIVIFCHLGVQFVLLGYLAGISPFLLWHQFFVAPTSLTILNSEEREEGIASFRIRCMGDTSHLYNGGEPVSDSGLFPRSSFVV